ncbi:DUF1707 and DUF4190 domain-containing protein [Streptomyces sp. NBC_00006]|uniref:DUF1707 and DUF4190 domain-containing protein n=1 Tax=unclassified Streptomyces TaxID=2593676 RepID=UPI00224E8491|nr:MULTISPECIES: DUF1707 and DUF4190 domain-containing protein [unclassified Streptomyces]MCX4828769.1 DUF1707 and DUF4190 domain-containing protein [Streptomyces sp. NBC_01016]MCX5531880.1 DUF1707 and DUF4190 domain-containing protein [Streptomyces sp. NBC_00006]
MSNPSWQPVPWPGHQGHQPSMLAAHADRERAVDVLRAGFAEGRLQQSEYERRIERAYQARTVGELTMLVADLPQGPAPQQQMQMQQPMMGVPRTFLPAPPPTNGKAIGALVCGVGTFFSAGASAIPAVILGHMARKEIRERGESGDGMAVGGLVLGWLSVAFWALIIVAIVVSAA